jgi:hypothetical protein
MRRTIAELWIRAGVVACVGLTSITAVVKLDDALGVYDMRADTQSAWSYEQRTGLLAGPSEHEEVVEEARLRMPRGATYKIVLGPRVNARATPSYTRHMLPWLMLPRRQTRSPSAEWMFCFGCRREMLGERFVVLARTSDGLLFGRVPR